jgi:hypothetical protein
MERNIIWMVWDNMGAMGVLPGSLVTKIGRSGGNLV